MYDTKLLHCDPDRLGRDCIAADSNPNGVEHMPLTEALDLLRQASTLIESAAYELAPNQPASTTEMLVTISAALSDGIPDLISQGFSQRP